MITKNNNLVTTDLDKVVKHNNETNTTEMGGNVEVDGDLQVNGEIISGLPTDISVFGNIDLGENETPYSKEQLLEIALKYNVNGFINPNSTDTPLEVGHITALNKNANSDDIEREKRLLFVISAFPRVATGGERPGVDVTICAWVICAYYRMSDDKLVLSYDELV